MSGKWRDLAKNRGKLRIMDRFSWWSGKYQENLLFQKFDKFFLTPTGSLKLTGLKNLSCMSLHPFLTSIGLRRLTFFDFPRNIFKTHWKRDYFSRPWIFYFILSIPFGFKFLEGPLMFAISKCQIPAAKFDRVQFFQFPSSFVLVCRNLLGIGSFSSVLSVFILWFGIFFWFMRNTYFTKGTQIACLTSFK